MSEVERGHSWLSPSGMKPIYYGCVAKPAMEKPFPNTSNKAADDGTLAHAWASHWLAPEANSAPKDACPEYLLEQTVAYVEAVRSLAEKDSKIIVEAKFEIFPTLGISGHVDAIVDNGEHIYVTDLKTGRTFVDVKHNVQMLCYALGYLQWKYGRSLAVLPKDFLEIRVFLGIFQYGKPSWYETTVGYIYGEFASLMATRASAAKCLYEGDVQTKNEDYKAGEWCQWCRAKLVCDAKKQYLQTEAQLDFEVVAVDGAKSLPVTKELSNEQLKKIVRVTPILEKYLEACHTELRVRAESVEGVPGVELHVSQGSRAWAMEREAEIVEFLESEGIEPYEQSLVGFTKLKKLAVPEELVTRGKEKIKIGIKND